MATIKKAQIGTLLNKGAKSLIKKTPKKITKFSSEAERIAAGQKPNLQKAKESVNSLDDSKVAGSKKSYSKKGLEMALERRVNPEAAKKKMTKAQREKFDLERSYYKNGGTMKKKMKNGGSLSGLKASTKRDKGIDPKGSWTKVQEKTLAGAKGKAKLTADKQLGATKMAKRGMKISKKK
jgi:hypothetical protein